MAVDVTMSGGGSTVTNTTIVKASRQERTANSNTTAAFGDVIDADATNGDLTVGLPTPESGKESIIVKKSHLDVSSNAVTLLGTINGVTNRSILTTNESLEVLSMGNGYIVI